MPPLAPPRPPLSQLQRLEARLKARQAGEGEDDETKTEKVPSTSDGTRAQGAQVSSSGAWGQVSSNGSAEAIVIELGTLLEVQQPPTPPPVPYPPSPSLPPLPYPRERPPLL